MFTNELRAIMSARTDGGEPSRAVTAADTRRPAAAAAVIVAVSRAARRWGGPAKPFGGRARECPHRRADHRASYIRARRRRHSTTTIIIYYSNSNSNNNNIIVIW